MIFAVWSWIATTARHLMRSLRRTWSPGFAGLIVDLVQLSHLLVVQLDLLLHLGHQVAADLLGIVRRIGAVHGSRC